MVEKLHEAGTGAQVDGGHADGVLEPVGSSSLIPVNEGRLK